jgi:hypothetical protein
MGHRNLQESLRPLFALLSRLIFLFLSIFCDYKWFRSLPYSGTIPCARGRFFVVWNLPSLVRLMPCRGVGCTALEQVRKRFKQDAWCQWIGLFGKYYRQALSRNDFSSCASLNGILTIGYIWFILGGRFPADPPLQTILLRQQHEYVMRTEINLKYPVFHGRYEAGAWKRHHGMHNPSK